MRFDTLSSFVVVLLAINLNMRADATPAALILGITGSVKLCEKEKCVDKDWVVLSPEKDNYRLLHKGDTFQCQKGARLHLYTESKLMKHPQGEIDNACDASGSQLIASFDAKSRHTLHDFEGYRIAGRNKGADSLVFVPPDNGSADPDKLVVHWRTRPPLKTVSMVVKSSDGTIIFKQDGIEGAAGMLDSTELRRALTALRDDPARSRNLTITLQATMRADDSIHFSLLSRAEVEAVDKELAAVPASPPAVRAIARASVYESARMYDLVAAEYDEALKQAPESLDLLRVAYSANTRIGNLQRARDLLDRLESAEGAR